METQETPPKPKMKIVVANLGQGTHIFGAAFVHPNGDTSKQCVCACPLMELGPKGTPKDQVEFTVEQFAFYDDDAMSAKVESREFAILVNGQDMRPDLARREAAKAAAASARPYSPATEAAASVETSVLAEILAEGDPKAE